jgi:hypothetical protein
MLFESLGLIVRSSFRGPKVAILILKNLQKAKTEEIFFREFFPASNKGGGHLKIDDRKKTNEECSISIFRIRG